MQVIAIDPGKHKCGLVECNDNRLTKVGMVLTEDLIDPCFSIPTYRNDDSRVAVIERPYVKTKKVRVFGRSTRIEYAQVAEHPEADIGFAMVVGEIRQAVRSIGFEIVEAPAWGPKSWIAEALSEGRKMPTTERVNQLTLALANNDYPDMYDWNEHTSAAYVMMTWWIAKMRYQERIKKRV